MRYGLGCCVPFWLHASWLGMLLVFACFVRGVFVALHISKVHVHRTNSVLYRRTTVHPAHPPPSIRSTHISAVNSGARRIGSKRRLVRNFYALSRTGRAGPMCVICLAAPQFEPRRHTHASVVPTAALSGALWRLRRCCVRDQVFSDFLYFLFENMDLGGACTRREARLPKKVYKKLCFMLKIQ